MNLQYSTILLLFLPLNILVKSYYVSSQLNNPSITTHHITTTLSRLLSEGDTQSSNYDKDTGMKSVMQQFVDRTSQRFQEYEERMKDKRQKRKEQRDRNIQKIIEEDKREKSLVEKVEKGCLKCGCALGGVAASVGVFGGLGVYGSKTAALAAATDAGVAEGLKVGLAEVMKIVTEALPRGTRATIPGIDLLRKMTTGISADNITLRGIFECISSNAQGQLYEEYQIFFKTVKTRAQQTLLVFNSGYNKQASAAVAGAFEKGKADAITAANSASTQLYSAIGYSVLAILIIVLVMIIIYLVLRYRRKKKMKKKDQYAKLLKE
ncbi:rifin PIR protein,putative [Plasmodium sp. DRC-Itaito]|nr:rifin PIR protein,putative [Plasmodium sp. DRC-Itaito]